MAYICSQPNATPGLTLLEENLRKTPQEVLSEFWDKFHTKYPGKVTSIFPRSLYRDILPPIDPRGARSCRDKVKRIVRECNRTNEKFTDPDFDIEHDANNNCLNGLVRYDERASDAAKSGPPVSSWDLRTSLQTLADSQMLGSGGTVPVDVAALGKFLGSNGETPWAFDGVSLGETYNPGSIHRIDWIFESPQFTVGGYSSSDIKQGANGDCWWLAAVATIAHRKDLMDRVCVARDEECGVYGFVFQRDGEWISTVVDDNLYLNETDFDYYHDVYDATGRKARLYRKQKQTGSEALYFARCEDPNETWLPILEKAYAKAHGDYQAISGGWPGEAVEDMTGGVTSTLATNRVLSKDKLWKELFNSDGEFVFAPAMGTGWDWQKNGLALGHAYSILQSREEVDEDGNKVRLVQIRNPWGERSYSGVGEWNGPWSDGSKEWTPYWLRKLGHTFGDDGIFRMSYKDMLDTFVFIHRTRLFDDKWSVIQQWTSASSSSFLYNSTTVTSKASGGEHYFELYFVLQLANAANGEHICRIRPVHKWENRSVSCEVELEPGIYEVLPKIAATRNAGAKKVEEVVKEYAENNPQKLRQVGMAYDLAHAKGLRKKEEKKSKHKAKQKKAIAKAAKATGKAADAMREVVKNDEKTNTQKEEKDGAAKEEPRADAEVTGPNETKDGGKSTEEQKPVPPSTEGGSTAVGSAKPADVPKTEATSAPKTEGLNDAPVGENDQSKDAATQDVVDSEDPDAKADDEEDEEKDESKSEDEKTDDETDDPSASSPWNAVAVIGLRVYSRDPEVSVALVKAAYKDENTTLTVDGKPAGATM
ncbi:uncharacterized protein BCR38DRAFT_455002 [Pseudomassariella vexata]|uniref:Calpain catalytic domain-containing protein n=1 Tax=Pseudomassariella vexata TaxID=1141098 RepID=A0A1Y2EEZ4_9PEZI|nr:uncharacterized protein BCR38DRAFT_455002 [Pseudomassariella vexata]ORY70141.1 hypothetical protein BCR38DRAFT_455002 [Pseudomassariella vexata]